MEYNVKISFKKDVSDKEKSERIKQFQDAFVVAAIGYYSNADKLPEKLTKKKIKNTVA